MKPYKGEIIEWYRKPFNSIEYENAYPGETSGLGYVIYGYKDKPKLGNWMRTSVVTAHDEFGNIETRNSRYRLIGPEVSNT